MPRRTPFRAAALPALAVSALLGGCALGSRPTPPAPPSPANPAEDVSPGWTQVGVASWYGPGFQGRRTASGERFDMEALTAAHPSLPFGTIVSVEHLETGRQVRLRINDRGPFVGGRIIDVSRRAARELGLIAEGVGRVRVEVLDVPAPEGCWEVQLGAFRDRANAEARRGSLEAAGLSVTVANAPGGVHRVRAGPFHDRSRAETLAREEGGLLVGCRG